MHAPGRGKSRSSIPYNRSKPSWSKATAESITTEILKFAKKGMTPSQIGGKLRDSYGVGQVQAITGNKILRILRIKGYAPDIPEDLYHLIKKAVNIRKHLEKIDKILMLNLD